jgi:hypothetical protein
MVLAKALADQGNAAEAVAAASTAEEPVRKLRRDCCERGMGGSLWVGGVGISVGDGGIGGSERLPAAPVNDSVLCFCFP